jgi:NADP-dependent 3-hydroxy acid dehydrogenase YdfG
MQAVVFGAGGSIGSAIAKEFAKEGAEVFLSGRTESTLEAVAKQIARTVAGHTPLQLTPSMTALSDNTSTAS